MGLGRRQSLRVGSSQTLDPNLKGKEVVMLIVSLEVQIQYLNLQNYSCVQHAFGRGPTNHWEGRSRQRSRQRAGI